MRTLAGWDVLIVGAGLAGLSTAIYLSRALRRTLALVESMTDRWDPDRYTDEYRSALLKLIHEKIEHGGKLPPGGGPRKRPSTKVIDLVSVLQESLERTQHPAAKVAQRSKRKHKPKTTRKAA